MLPFEAIPPIRWRDGTITEVDDAPAPGLAQGLGGGKGAGKGAGNGEGQGLGTTPSRTTPTSTPTRVRMGSALSKAANETPSFDPLPPPRDLSPKDLTRLKQRVEVLEEEKKRVKARLLPGPKGGGVQGTSVHVHTSSPHPATAAAGATAVAGGGSAITGSGSTGGAGSKNVTHEILRVDIRRQDA